MNRLIPFIAVLFVGLSVRAANPAFTDFATNEFLASPTLPVGQRVQLQNPLNVTNITLLVSNISVQNITNVTLISSNIITTNLFATNINVQNITNQFFVTSNALITNLTVQNITNINEFHGKTSFITNLSVQFITNNTAYITNLFATIITNNTFYSSNAFITNLTVVNLTNQFQTNIFVNNFFTNLNVTNLTVNFLTNINQFFSSNAFITNLTVNVVTNNLFVSSNAFITNLTVNFITNTTLITSNAYITNLTVNNAFITNLTVQNLTNQFTTNIFVDNFFTNLFVTNLTATTITNVTFISSNAFITNLTVNNLLTSNAFITNLTVNNLISTNFFTSNAFITNLTVQNITNTTFISSNAFITNLTVNNLVSSNAFFTNVFVTSNAYTPHIIAIDATFTNNAAGQILVFDAQSNIVWDVEGDSVGGSITYLNGGSWTTNSFKYPSNLFASSLTATNAITNRAFAASGIVTNDAAGGLHTTPTLQNALLANSSITIAGTANQVLVSGGGPVALGGTATLSTPQDIGIGSSPTFNLVNSTNYTTKYPTNAVPTTGILTFGQSYETNLQANITLGSPILSTAYYETLVLDVTNSTSSDHTLTMPGGVIGTPGSGTPAVFTFTNKLGGTLYMQHFGTKRTNAWVIPWGP